MKILVISKYYPPHFQGGYELSCQQMVEELQRRKNMVLVVTSNWHSEKVSGESHVKRFLHVKNFGQKKGLRRRIAQMGRIATGLQDYYRVRKLILTYQPDVAYIWSMSGLSLMPLIALQKLKVPMVFDLGDYWLFEKWSDLFVEKKVLKKVYRGIIYGGGGIQPSSFRCLLTHSQVMKQCYVDQGFPAGSITVIPRGLPRQTIAEAPCHNNGDQSTRMLYGGRLSEEKGVHLAIEAIEYLVKQEQMPSVHLDIIGTGDDHYACRLQQMVISSGMQHHVRFLGQIPNSGMIALYPQYSILLFPSIWVEPFGRSVIEAMAQGVCVIASNRGGPTEIITHGQDGFLVPPGDAQAIAQAAARLVRDPHLRNQIGQAAIATVRQRYTLDRIGDQIEGYLNRVRKDAPHATYQS